MLYRELSSNKYRISIIHCIFQLQRRSGTETKLWGLGWFLFSFLLRQACVKLYSWPWIYNITISVFRVTGIISYWAQPKRKKPPAHPCCPLEVKSTDSCIRHPTELVSWPPLLLRDSRFCIRCFSEAHPYSSCCDVIKDYIVRVWQYRVSVQVSAIHLITSKYNENLSFLHCVMSSFT